MLYLQREDITPQGVTGMLFVNGPPSEDGAFCCYTLEPPMDVPHPAIPAGQYMVYPWPSPKFKRTVLRFAHVPGRTDILIHPGNTIADTQGCILVGLDRRGTVLLHSRRALEKLLDYVVKPERITIADPAGERGV